jgi:Xaa-Pro aminopeptidase
MDLFWATGFPTPDPYPFFRIRGRSWAIVSDLEIGRARAHARVHHVLALSKYLRRLERAGNRSPDATDALVAALVERSVTRARVPRDFPVWTADRIRDAGIEVGPVKAPFWPERARKTAAEIESIRESVHRTSEAIGAGIELIRRSRPVRGVLRTGDGPLTSERVRHEIDRTLAENGMEARNTIVAGGEQGVDPHDRGSGPLPAGYPVIIDCFPRSLETGYHADITRTVFRGRPKPEHRRMWEAVRTAQRLGCELARAGAIGRDIHARVSECFEEAGFETGTAENGKMQGFFHGTGHGLGLDVHEPPFFSRSDEPLLEGMVITIEPGLYYPGLGGIRIEDDIVVRADGHENLVTAPREFVV